MAEAPLSPQQAAQALADIAGYDPILFANSGNSDGGVAFMVFDMPDSSDMVPFGEPFFMALDADVEVVPVMNADDLQKGFGKLG